MELQCPNCKHDFRKIRKNHYKCTHCKREYILVPTYIYYLCVGILALVLLKGSESIAHSFGWGREYAIIMAMALALVLSFIASKFPALLLKLKFYRIMELN